MKELRPLGSEKLNGDEKLNRILELTYWGDVKKKPSVNKPEFVTESKIGGVYGIVKEKDGFYVKKGLNESSLEYIGGMFMKNKNRFSSYGEAFKRLEYLKGQDILQEATKYVLKQAKPSMEAPAPVPAMSEPPAPENTDIPPIPTGEEPSPEDEMPMGDEGGEENLRSGYMEAIQKWSGKLGQELRDQKEKLESDDIKYVLNMVISALDLQKLDDEDMEEIASKFDRDEEEFENPDGDTASEDDFNLSEPDEEVDETMDKLQNFVDTPTDDDEMFSEFSLGNDESEFGEEEEVVMHHDAQPELDQKPRQPKFKTKPVHQTKEFELDELADAVNRMIKDNLSKYFE